MRRTLLTAALALLLLAPSCRRILGDEEEAVDPVDHETIERVVDGILGGLAAKAEEMGPRFPVALPELKDAVAKDEGFADFEQFRRRVHKTDPVLEVQISRRITDRIRALLPAEDPGPDPRSR